MAEVPDVIKKGQKRVWYQRGGTLPSNIPQYYGKDGQYVIFTGAEREIRGGVDPVQIGDPDRLGEFVNVGMMTSPAAFPAGTLELRERKSVLPFIWGDLICPTTIYIPTGDCKSPSDFNYGWTDYVEIWSNGLAVKIDGGDRGAFDNNEAIEDGVDYVFMRQYLVGSLQLSEQAASTILTEVNDVTFGNKLQCSTCGPNDDGTRWRYALVAGGVASKPSVTYSNDGGRTWSALIPIDAAANAEIGNAIEVIGNYLVVLSPTAQTATNGGYYYAPLNLDTGAPSATWTKVTSGFVNNSEPRDMHVINEREIFIVGDSGYIYKSTNILTGVSVVNAGNTVATDLLRVHGIESILVASGASGKVLVSYDRGSSWAVTAADPDSTSITAIAVKGRKHYWAGSADGQVYYTENGGASWTEVTFGVTLATIQDIVFATDECGFILAATAAPAARLFSTLDGGATWARAANNSPRLLNEPTEDRFNRIAVPRTSAPVAANTILLGGLDDAGTDGALYQAQAVSM